MKCIGGMMSRKACEKCKKDGAYIEMGTCMRDHPEFVKSIIGREGQNLTLLNDSGSSIKFGTIDSENMNKLVIFRATIMQTSDIMNYYIQKTYNCKECGESVTKTCDDYRDIYEKEIITVCPHCEKSPMFLDKGQCIVGNVRKVVLQEVNDESGINPRRIEAHLTSKNVFDLQAGKDYKFEARVWSVASGKKENFNRFVLDVKRVRCLDEDTEIIASLSEIETMRKMDKRKIIESLAPQIIYRGNEKMALIISYLSGGRVDGIRGDLSTMFVGDPSTAKSELLNALHSLDNKSFKVSGRATSAAGLVMGVDNLPDGTRMATFGPVILAHEHFVCIDEGDKMADSDRSMLHDVMEDEVAHLNKVGINITMNAQTKIIMACNPKKSRYNSNATIMTNIGMPNSFLARFGYIFLMLDNFDKEMERDKLRRINRIKVGGLEAFIKEEGLLSRSDLTKYLNYAKTLNPKFESDSLSKLEDVYLELKFKEQDYGSLDIDTRAYYDIIRASFAFARFRLSTKVETIDINMAWKLYNQSLASFGMKTQGEFREKELESRTTLSDLQETL